VSGIVGEITAASMEQSEGIGQVNRAVSELDNATQQNAALVEETAAASENMNDQAVALRDRVKYFKVS
jgi:methyl-accepting chemotaxis protein